MYWGIENVDGSIDGEKKKDFYLTDFESDSDYYRKAYRNTYGRRPRYSNIRFAATRGKPKCKSGYKLIKVKGKYICRKKTYPWKVFPRGGLAGFGTAIGKVGNFLFMIMMIGAAIYFAPTIVKAITSSATGALDVYGQWKKVRSIPTKKALGGDLHE